MLKRTEEEKERWEGREGKNFLIIGEAGSLRFEDLSSKHKCQPDAKIPIPGCWGKSEKILMRNRDSQKKYPDCYPLQS